MSPMRATEDLTKYRVAKRHVSLRWPFEGGRISMVQLPPTECFWSGAGVSFVAV